ncbi:hypothetical protein DFH28DRAFT_1221385 [Melampsora americana]|nr:hypothetical protein DFH28DRAFT_1221385 [Melampsora americana]
MPQANHIHNTSKTGPTPGSNGRHQIASLATPTPMSRKEINAAAARLYLLDSSRHLGHHNLPDSNSQIIAAKAFTNSPTQTQIGNPITPLASSINSSQASGSFESPDDCQVLDGIYLPDKITYQQRPIEHPRVETVSPRPDRVVDITLSYTLYTRKVADPFLGSSTKKGSKTAFLPYKIPARTTQFQLTRMPLVSLKEKLFVLANELDPAPDLDGNLDILNQADALGNVIIQVYISEHPTYGKSKDRKLTSDKGVRDFYNQIDLNPTKEAGIQNLSISHARVVAKNVKNARPITSSTVVESIPIPNKKKLLAELLTKYTTAHNNSREGWRIYNRQDVSMVMNLSHAHMVLWAGELAAKDPRVSLEKPPEHLDKFVWEDIKRPLSLSTPAKCPKTEVSPSTSQATSTPISQQPDYSEVDRLVKKATLNLFLVFAEVPDEKLPHVSKTLYEHDITNFDMFLPPEDFTARDVQQLGISWGISKRLFREAPKYYRHLLEREAAEAIDQSASNETSHSGTTSEEGAEFGYDDSEYE